MTRASVLWRRLDTPGHDACRLVQTSNGWVLEGSAVFLDEMGPAQLDYRLSCDAQWRTRQGRVRGWRGKRLVSFDFARTRNGWTMNGASVRGLRSLVDLDLGFTPATNLSQLRRIALRPGQSATVAVAWFDLSVQKLVLLEQRYERRSPTSYWYESPAFDYAALLRVNANGFVLDYPRLWKADSG
jgi:hypothetical protein